MGCWGMLYSVSTLVISDYRRLPEIAAFLWRRRELGLDRLDESWDGVLHMSPPPPALHGECAGWLNQILRHQAQRHACGRVTLEAGVRQPGTGRSNFRVPDISLIPP